MIIDEQQTAEPNLSDVEAELCRLPDVVAVRIVSDDAHRPVEVHVLAHTGKHAKQVVRDVQSVALASFGLDIDRRIVSVVQLQPDDEAAVGFAPSATVRPRIMAVDSHISGARITVHVSLRTGDDEATGYSEGSAAVATRPRLVAAATIDALAQLGTLRGVDVGAAETVRVGTDDVAVVTLICVNPPYELRLCGSALVRQHPDDATVRAVLDGLNRRLPTLAPERGAS
ncbi:MAG: hypothetical protein WD598_15620 [Acidimicrobiia bacterium]